MHVASRILSSTYTKIVFGAIVAFIGVAGGMYVGNAVTGRKPTHDPPKPETAQSDVPSPYLTIVPGDLFPFESYMDRDGNTGNFEQLLNDKNSLLLFVSLSCPPCFDLLEYTKKSMLSRLRPGVQVIACFDTKLSPIPEEYAGLLKSVKVVFYDGKQWESRYHMVVWPTIVGVDDSGFIRHIQFGYDGAIEHELVAYFYKSNL